MKLKILQVLLISPDLRGYLLFSLVIIARTSKIVLLFAFLMSLPNSGWRWIFCDLCGFTIMHLDWHSEGKNGENAHG